MCYEAILVLQKRVLQEYFYEFLSYNLPWAADVWRSRDENTQKNTEQVKMVNMADYNLSEFKDVLCSFIFSLDYSN